MQPRCCDGKNIERACAAFPVVLGSHQVPSAWEKLAYPSMRSLPLWLSNLQVKEARFHDFQFLQRVRAGHVFRFLRAGVFRVFGGYMSQNTAAV